MIWWQSRTFKALLQTSVLMILGWLVVAISTNVWDWRAGLVVPLLSNALVQLRDMWSPTVTGPLSFMNKNNVVTIPASSIPPKDGEPVR